MKQQDTAVYLSELVLCIAFACGLGVTAGSAQTSSSRDIHRSYLQEAKVKPTATPALRAVSIAPTTLGLNSTSVSGGDDFLNLEGFDLRRLLARAYNVNTVQIDLPQSVDGRIRYDVSVKLANPASETVMNSLIRQALENRFHLAASHVYRDLDVYLITALDIPPTSTRAPLRPTADSDINTAASGSIGFRVVKPSQEAAASTRVSIDDVNSISMMSVTIKDFCQILEENLERPVVDETQLQGRFNFDLKSTSDTTNDLLMQLRTKMNLSIQPSKQAVEIIVFTLTK